MNDETRKLLARLDPAVQSSGTLWLMHDAGLIAEPAMKRPSMGTGPTPASTARVPVDVARVSN